jgi:cell wall-associated NlpC family hydrolase
MNKRRNLKNMLILSLSSLVVSLSLPLGSTQAASVYGTSSSDNGLMQSIFKRVGLSYPAVTAPKKPVQKPSTPVQKPSTPVQKPSIPVQKPSTPVQKPSSPAPRNDISAAPKEQSSARLALADKIIATGEKYLGTPYRLGSPSGYTRTFDCSSFVQYVYSIHGIKLPRSSRQQATVGKTVPRNQIEKGDLLFFTTRSSGGRIGHVGIYAGNNKVLHTWGPGGVRYDSLSTGWLREGYVTAKRVIPE